MSVNFFVVFVNLTPFSLDENLGLRYLSGTVNLGELLTPPIYNHTMLTIRLSRVGKAKQPNYRLIVSEKTKDPWGDSLEILGTYNPLREPPIVNFKADRITYWISKGAQTSDTVRNLLIDQKIIEGAKRKKVSMSKRRAEKMAKKKAA